VTQLHLTLYAPRFIPHVLSHRPSPAFGLLLGMRAWLYIFAHNVELKRFPRLAFALRVAALSLAPASPLSLPLTFLHLSRGVHNCLA
jgi:hypothetical protein